MIRAIIFDCFGVLYRGSLEHLRELTPPEKREELSDLSRSSDYGYLSYDDYMAQVAQLTGRTTTEIEHIVSADHIRNESLVGIVRSLRADFKVGLLSNVGRDLIARLFSEEEVSTLFDAVVLSSEVGMVKPYPEIFELMADRLDVRPDECLMIDDMPDNIAGAESVGMQGIVFKTNDELESTLKRSVGSSSLK